MPTKEIASGRPVLSLTLDDRDLNDPDKGILPNKQEHGVEWEREGSVSVLRGRQAAVRRRSGRSHSRRRQPYDGSSARVSPLFPPTVWTARASAGRVVQRSRSPVRRIVVHDDVRRTGNANWYFVNPLAYDIARAVGAIAPETKPVRFYLNGEYYGPFVLTERFDQRFFAAHWGYDDIDLTQEDMDRLFAWVRTTRPLTLENVAQHVNIDNLTKWFVAVAFSATRDAYQGPGQFLDHTKPAGGWFWVSWDMDQSFRDWNLDSYQVLVEPCR